LADELAPIRRAAQGLTYPSETDAPVDVFSWPAGPGTAEEAVAANGTKASPVEEVPVATFFGELNGIDDAPRFEKLRQAMEMALSDLRVIRAGKTTVQVYVLGRRRSGGWAGVHTTSVET
jgi:hypothetical protein